MRASVEVPACLIYILILFSLLCVLVDQNVKHTDYSRGLIDDFLASACKCDMPECLISIDRVNFVVCAFSRKH